MGEIYLHPCSWKGCTAQVTSRFRDENRIRYCPEHKLAARRIRTQKQTEQRRLARSKKDPFAKRKSEKNWILLRDPSGDFRPGMVFDSTEVSCMRKLGCFDAGTVLRQGEREVTL